MGYSRSDLAAINLESVEGIKPAFIEKCRIAEMETVDDLLSRYPRRYLDRTRQVSIGELFPGEEATIYATVEAISTRRMKNYKTMVEAVIADATSRVKITFFNQPWRAKQLKVGTQAAFFGKMDEYRGQPQIVNPVVDIIREDQDEELDRTGSIIPIYPQSGKADLSTWHVRTMMEKVLSYSDQLEDILEPELLEELKLVSRVQAYRNIHKPENEDDARQGARRLRFDEFLMLQMVLVGRYLHNENVLVAQTLNEDFLEKSFIASLPFELTKSQGDAIAEIDADMASSHPMHRLLQGDVGSGKTVVAFAACMRAVSSGAQAIVMAPTEVLVNQHYATARALFSSLEVKDDSNLFSARPVRVEMLSNSTSAKDRERIERDIENGDCDIVISTHAMLYNEWKFANLGLVVVDEQHRFGVEQRSALLTRSESTPHMIVMSATPIPRTAAMLYFGDLKNTIMKDMPKGRKPVMTKWAKTQTDVDQAYERVRSEVKAGRQAYVVCALVNESDKVQASSAVDHVQQLRADQLKGLSLGLVHGQMSSNDKDEVMALFVSGEIDVLVSTTVIEVGVDVANATVMVIEDADRFGLSQLHQLRGRVGRGADESFCYLISEKDTTDAVRRLEAMEKISDGFELAEIDLDLRGAGHVLGGVQSGQGDLRLGRLPRDAKYVQYAHDIAMKKLMADPTMSSDVNATLAKEMSHFLDENDIDFLFKS
ncbi:MAG TPA: ATP-dependent DNA helicase RecG [Acidimicrobiia bacterium]|nr:ATP-dependent DNA helicase RecG [Acidimicrobiia bacterium]